MLTSDKVLDYAQILLAHCRISLAYLETYNGLCTRHNQAYDIMLEAVLFFNVVEKSLMSELMMETCKLFEDDTNVISIFKLTNICEQNKKLFSGITLDFVVNGEILPFPFSIDRLLDTVKKDLDKQKPIIDNLKAQRDQIWAHNDKKYFLSPATLENKYPIKLKEIETLLHMVSNFSNSIIAAFTKSIASPWFNSPDACDKDVERIIELMKLGRQKEIENNVPS